SHTHSTVPHPVSLSPLNNPPTPNISTLSLHDALPIYPGHQQHDEGDQRRHHLRLGQRGDEQPDGHVRGAHQEKPEIAEQHGPPLDRKSTRLNSSHVSISYAVFCLKKKKIIDIPHDTRV